MIRLAIRVREADAELVLAELLELVPSGLEERELGSGVIEYALYGAPGELPALPVLRASVGDALVEIATSEVPEDWSERWKQFHRPVLIQPPAVRGREAAGGAASAIEQLVPALRVRPPWTTDAVRDDTLEIVIDPGQAFGTGSHASTRLCLELLLALAASDEERGPVLDVGTGSGVLAIAASLLGYAPVVAFDVERASVEAARENVARNRASVAVERCDLREGVAAWERPPIVLANLVRPLLIELARALPGTPAQLIAGGLLGDEVDEVRDVYAGGLRLRERERRRSPEWAAVWLSPAPDRP